MLPANEGRGYVLRRIMRRAMRHAHLLGAAEPLMHRLVPSLVAEMGAAYPELVRAQPLIEETLKLEETRFRQTLDNGLRLLDEATGAHEARRHACRARSPSSSTTRSASPTTSPRTRCARRASASTAPASTPRWPSRRRAARAAWKGSGAKASEDVWFDIAEEQGSTEFTGYAGHEGEGVVVALVKDGARVERAGAGDKVVILTNQTPFYGESGGQMGDTGTISGDKGLEAEVEDTSKPLGRLHAHHAVDQGGRGRGRRRRPPRGRCRAPRRGSAPTTAPPICSTPRCATGSAAMSPRRAAWSRPTASASISRIPRR